MERILITDDHPLVRDGLRALLGSAFPGCEFAEAASLHEAIALLAASPAVDLVMLDLDLPDAKHLDALSQLRARFPSIPIAILSGSKDPSLVRAAMASGASGFISKSQRPDMLVAALETIRDTGAYVGPAPASPGPDEERVLRNVGALTPQQRAVFRMIVEGRLNKQIAHELQISLTTVKAHVSALLSKLEVVNRTQAALLAKRFNLFP